MKKGKRWPGGVATKRRHLSPSDIKRKEARRGMIHEGNVKTARLDAAVLERMQVKDLRTLCDERGIKWNTKIRKSGLIEMLVGR